MPQNCTSEELAKLTPTIPESSKTQQQKNKLAAQVLFQARRVDKPSGQSHCIFVCALSQMKEFSFGNADDLLSHARKYHVSIAMAYPDGSAWKFYLFNCAERAKDRNHVRNNPFLQLNSDHMRFLGPGTAHGIRPQPYNLLPSKAKNLDKMKSGPTVPLKRSAETGPPGKVSKSQTDFNEEPGSRKRHVGSANSNVPGSKAIPPSHGSSPKDGTRKGRSGNSRPTLKPAGRKRKVDLLLEPCLECHRRGSRCSRLLSDARCEPCRSNGLECKVLDHDSNVAQAPESTSGDEQMNSPAGSVTDDALCSSSETIEDETSASYNDNTSIEVLLQPQTKAITLEQLEVEVENIHKAVDNLEASCRQGHQDMVAQVQLPHAQRLQIDYSAFIGRHKSFLQEIHDLCLATQHPVASEKLRSLPKRINVPARLWQTGVASPLEILRMLLPESREHAITFIQTCFNMTALFFETVPEFDSTWLECLGDLSRYRLGLADKDEDTETFSSIATYWFRRALDIIPQTGRLRHHLAVLVPNFSVEQLSLYGHALTAYVPFYAARKSFLASLRPVLEDTRQLSEKVPRLILTFLRAHAALFAGGPGSLAIFNNSTNQIKAGMFDSFIQTASKEKSGLKKFGVHVAIANSAAIMEYGATMEDQSVDRSLIRYAFLTRHVAQIHSTSAHGPTLTNHSAAVVPGGNTILSRITIYHSCRLAFGMLSVALRRPRDENLHPMVHVSSVMLWAFCNVHAVITEVENMIPWNDLVAFLNIWSNALTMKPYLTSPNFPHAEPASGEALPEDFMMQGLWFSQDYLPNSWCENADLDLQERLVEKETHIAPRVERILWLAYGIASHGIWMHFDRETKSFRSNDAYIDQLKHPLNTTELNCELEPLYPSEAQSPSNAISWNSHAPLRQGIVPGRGPHSRPRLLMLSHRWSDFRQQCENFLSSPPKKQETLLQSQRQLGETIAQDFLAVVESLRDERDTQRVRGHEWHQFEHDRQNLKLDMQNIFRKIHQVAQDARILENIQMSTDPG